MAVGKIPNTIYAAKHKCEAKGNGNKPVAVLEPPRQAESTVAMHHPLLQLLFGGVEFAYYPLLALAMLFAVCHIFISYKTM